MLDAPPRPPYKEDREEKTTTDRSSLFPLGINPDTTGAARLIAVCMGYFPEATEGMVRSAIEDFSEEWVGRAVIEYEVGNFRSDRWAYLLGILGKFRDQGGPPRIRPPKPVPGPAAGPAVPRIFIPDRLPAGAWPAEQIEELVNETGQHGAMGTLAQHRLVLAIQEGHVRPEQGVCDLPVPEPEKNRLREQSPNFPRNRPEPPSVTSQVYTMRQSRPTSRARLKLMKPDGSARPAGVEPATFGFEVREAQLRACRSDCSSRPRVAGRSLSAPHFRS